MNDSMFDDLPSLVRDARAWYALRDTLCALAEQRPHRLRYVPNGGNAGDALIAAGSWQFFDDIGVQPTYAKASRLTAGDVAIHGGGGNHDSCAIFLEQCLKVGVVAAVVMPHTMRGHEQLLAQLDERFTLVCRDTASMQVAQAAGTRAHLIFAPDMGLYVDVVRLFRRCQQYSWANLWLGYLLHGRLFGYLSWRLALARRTPPRHGHVRLMRLDEEATPDQPGNKQWDVSRLYDSKLCSREESDMVSRDFLRFFGRVSSVRTNRLHAGVAGALMGCDVTYFDNSHGKVGAVYDAWLSHLPFVSFHGAPNATAQA